MRALKESDAYPAMAERGYGWEKLIVRDVLPGILGRARHEDVHRPLPQRLRPARHLGRRPREGAGGDLPQGHRGEDSRQDEITIWGDGTQTRSFMYIDDCVKGIDMIMHCDELIATPINLGSSELVSINDLVSMVEEIAGREAERANMTSTRPAAWPGRNSDNTFIQQVLGWEPKHAASRTACARTYDWIEQQYLARKAGERVVEDVM